jgi:hypothetical protein
MGPLHGIILRRAPRIFKPERRHSHVTCVDSLPWRGALLRAPHCPVRAADRYQG